MLEVFRKVGEMLGLISPAKKKESTAQPAEHHEYFIPEIEKSQSYYRTGPHYHVLVGDERVYWYGASKYLGPVSDHIFNDPEKAHHFFANLITSALPDYLDDEDLEESFDEFIGAIDSYVENFSDRPEQGIYFQPMDLKLLVCGSCVPILNN